MNRLNVSVGFVSFESQFKELRAKKKRMDSPPDDSQEALLNACADVILACDDGVEIPLSKFTCMTASPVLREALRLSTVKDDAGRVVVQLSRGSFGLASALSIIHATRSIFTMPVDDLMSSLEGFDYLGGGSVVMVLATAALHRAWMLMSSLGLKDVKPHLQRLLDSPTTRDDVLLRLVALCIGWQPFVDALEDVIIDSEIAKSIVGKLGKYYPPILLLRFCLRRLKGQSPDSAPSETAPSETVPSETVLSLAAQQGVYYHPPEVLEAMREVQTLVGPASSLVRTWIDGMSTVELAPRLGGISASIICYHESTTSVLFDLEDASRGRAHQRRRFAPWLVLHWGHPNFDAVDGFDADVTLAKIDREGRAARRMDARLIGFSGDRSVVYEQWHSFSSLNPRDTLRLSTGTTIYAAPRQPGRVHRLRLDLFYSGSVPVWQSCY